MQPEIDYPELNYPEITNQCTIPRAICKHHKTTLCAYYTVSKIKGICKYLDQGCYCKSQVAWLNNIQAQLDKIGFTIKAKNKE